MDDFEKWQSASCSRGHFCEILTAPRAVPEHLHHRQETADSIASTLPQVLSPR